MKALLSGALILSSTASAEPLVFDNGRVFIHAEINGVATEALLDSGAEASLIDDQLATEAAFPEGKPITIRGSGGSMQATVVPGVAIRALGVTVKPEAVVVMDLNDLSERLIKRPTRAVIGRALFDSGRYRIDIRARIAEQVDRQALPPGRELTLTAHAGIESIPATVNGVAANAEFDLGNGSEVMVSRAFAESLGLKVQGRKSGGGIGREIMRDIVTLDRLEVAGTTFSNVAAAIDDQPNANDLNVGTSILRDFVITTDFPQRRIWLLPRGGESG